MKSADADSISVILGSKLMTNVTEEMFAEGYAITEKALNGEVDISADLMKSPETKLLGS